MSTTNYARLLRGEILTQWTLLDSNAVDVSDGDRSQIINQLSSRYGFSSERAERELNRVQTELSEKLKRAA